MTDPHAALAARLDARRPELAARSITAMYAEDPFWEARFGARGRKFSDQDGVSHVQYLAQALRDGSPARLETYARWLQVVLTTRGMCSRHLARNFATLLEAMEAVDVTDRQLAVPYLEAAARALRHESPIAAALQDAEDVVAERALTLLRDGHRDWSQWADAAREARVRQELVTLASFVADASQLGTATHLAAHLAWLEGAAASRGERAGYAGALVDALADAWGVVKDEVVRTEAARLLAAARSTPAPMPTPMPTPGA